MLMPSEQFEPLFEYLEKRGLALEALHSSLERWTLTQLLTICRNISEALPGSTSQASTPFNFVASPSLSGGPSPCSALECRLDRLDSLAQFAALYADRVLIPDPFFNLLEEHSHDVDSVREELSVHVAALFRFRPLMEAGIIEFVSSKHRHICVDCYEKALRKKRGAFKRQLRSARSYLTKTFLSETHAVIKSDEYGPYVDLKGPEFLFEHGHLAVALPPESDLAKHVHATRPRRLGGEVLQRSGLLEFLVKEVVDDVLFANLYVNQLGMTYLTGRDIDAAIISQLNRDVGRTNLAIASAFRHSLPLIENASTAALVKLRKEEQEAFAVYRDALSKALKAAPSIEERQLGEIFKDIVSPELNKIQRAMANARKVLKEDIRQDLVFGAGWLTVGLYLGMIPANVLSLVALIGASDRAYDVLKKTNLLFREPAEIRESPYYFLWKAKTEGKHLKSGARRTGKDLFSK